MLSHEFVRNALLAGTPLALATGLVGYFVVLRAQVFAGDALSHVAFTGSVAAAAAGADPRLGLFAATILIALLLGGLGGRAPAGDATIGVVFAWVLGLGVLCLTVFTDRSGDGLLGARTLFGSIFGLSRSDAWIAVGVCGVVTLGLGALARPLLFASVDPDVAALRGVPVRALGLALLALLGATTAEATQSVGALLFLGLLAAPAGAAQTLTASPYRGLLLAVAFAVASVWAGVAIAYLVPALPPGSAIVAVACAIYAVALAARAGSGPRRWRRRGPGRAAGVQGEPRLG